DVTPGVNYSLAITSAAGLWACLVGLTVCFRSVHPPLFHSIEVAGEQHGVSPAWAPSEVLPLRTELPAAPPHPQSGDTPAAPARNYRRRREPHPESSGSGRASACAAARRPGSSASAPRRRTSAANDPRPAASSGSS